MWYLPSHLEHQAVPSIHPDHCVPEMQILIIKLLSHYSAWSNPNLLGEFGDHFSAMERPAPSKLAPFPQVSC